MSRLISKKVLASYYHQLVVGQKTFECRFADWDCQPGDRLRLIEVDDQTRQPTGRQLECTAGSIVKTKQLDFWPKSAVDQFGYQVISVLDVRETGSNDQAGVLE